MQYCLQSRAPPKSEALASVSGEGCNESWRVSLPGAFLNLLLTVEGRMRIKLQRIVFKVTVVYLFYLFVCWGLARVEVRGSFLGVGSLLLPCVSWGSNSDFQAWQQAPIVH